MISGVNFLLVLKIKIILNWFTQFNLLFRIQPFLSKNEKLNSLEIVNESVQVHENRK